MAAQQPGWGQALHLPDGHQRIRACTGELSTIRTPGDLVERDRVALHDGTLRVWEVERGQCVHIMQGYAVSLYDVAWRPDGTQLARARSHTLVTIWEVEGLTPPRLLRGHRSLVFGVAWSPDGRFLASSGLDNAVRLWDATTGEARQILRDPDHVNALFYGVAWSPDGKFLASASYQQGIQVWEVTSGTRRWVSRAQPTRIRRVAWVTGGTA